MSTNRLNSLSAAFGFIASGIVLLLFTLDTLGDYQAVTQMVLAALLVVGGISFFVAYIAARSHWWRLIPAWTLVTLGLIVYLTPPSAATSTRSAALLFGGLALAFAHVYLLNRLEHWWAIMPGGFMLVLSLVILLSQAITSLNTLAAILFAGLGLVFGLVYLLGDRYRQWWAVLPGILLLTFGLFFFFSANAGTNQFTRWWPLLLILIGLGIGWRGLNQPPRDKMEVHAAPLRKANVTLPQSASKAEEKSRLGVLGEYSRPAPGASVEVLPEIDE